MKTKLVAASIGVAMAVVLAVGGTFAWLIMSQAPQVKQMQVNVSNSTILEIAQAYPDNYLTGPPEVGEDDLHKTRIVEGQSIQDQGVWGKLVDMSNTQIILQEPATYNDQTNALATVKFDKTGRTNGLMPLDKQDIDPYGLVYYTKTVTDGNYRGTDGKIYTATSSMAAAADATLSDGKYTGPVDVKCAGGIALWMRSNKPTSEEVFLKGLTISKATDDGSTEEVTYDDILGVLVNTYHLEKAEGAKATDKGTLKPFNNYYATKTDEGYTCTLFAGSAAQQMQPGELYLVEIICYIEGNRENSMGNTAAIADNSGETRKVTFDDIECQDVLYAAKVTEVNNVDRKNGWFADKTKLRIELFGSAKEVDTRNIVIDYKLTTEADPNTVITREQFPAFDSAGNKNHRDIDLEDGTYLLTVMTALTDGNGNIRNDAQKYYTVSISDTSMVNTKEDDITIRVDSLEPVLAGTTLGNCGCDIQSDDGLTYHNHDVTVSSAVVEKNISTFKIGGRKITPVAQDADNDIYGADRLYSTEGKYTVDVVVTDRTGKKNKAGAKDDDGKLLDQVSFVIDKTKPVVSNIEWSFYNNEGIADVFSRLTGSQFFTDAVQLKITGTDENIKDIECYDSKGSVISNVVRNGNGKEITATVDLDMNYSDEITIKITDKAGNVTRQSTGYITINDEIPTVEETHTGEKVDEDADEAEWYDITYKLTAIGTNADRVTEFEFSTDANTWYKEAQHIGSVYYDIEKDRIAGDTVTLHCDYNTTASGTIFFRPVTDITADAGDDPYVVGMPIGKSFKLAGRKPEAPTVRAECNGEEYEEGTPTNGEIRYYLSSGEMHGLEIDSFEYSLDNLTWHAGTQTVNGITIESMSGSGYIVSGAAGIQNEGKLYFRTVSRDDKDQIVNGLATEAYSFEIDSKAPVISEPAWKIVNYETSSKVINTLTGQLFFNKMLTVTVRADDENMKDLTCDSTESLETVSRKGSTYVNQELYFDPSFKGEITFKAVDKAGNEATLKTEY